MGSIGVVNVFRLDFRRRGRALGDSVRLNDLLLLTPPQLLLTMSGTPSHTQTGRAVKICSSGGSNSKSGSVALVVAVVVIVIVILVVVVVVVMAVEIRLISVSNSNRL